MAQSRRSFLKAASLATVAAASGNAELLASDSKKAATRGANAYTHRIAYGCWLNDMRLDPLPLEDWPAPQVDDETVRSVTKALDLQSRFGYNYLDAWGFFATKSWPLNIGDGVSRQRRLNVKRIIQAAHDRGIKVIYGMGTYSWGYDDIIKNDPSLAGKNRDGSPHVHAMCDANPKSFQWVQKILDFTMSEFPFDGVHLESFDLGGCFCPKCAGKDGIVAYHTRINCKTADYIRSKWPDKLIHVIPISWAVDNKERFTEADKKIIIELSKHIDGFYDQGWNGTYIAPEERESFIKKLHCTYGTSGGRWLYPAQRWDRESFFLPHIKHQGVAIRQQYKQGVRGCMHYQGPVSNPGTEVNIAFGGLMLSDASRDIETALSEVIEVLYKPKNEPAHKKLTNVFLKGEDAYFDQWGDAVKRFAKHCGKRPSGEFYMDSLFGDSPGPAGYLIAPQYLYAAGRLAYKKALIPLLRDIEQIEGDFNDQGRMKALKRSIIITLTILNTILEAKGEPSK